MTASRAERIRKAVPGLAEADITALAGLPPADVAVITRALRQARREGVVHDREQRRQRKADNRRHGNYDESQLTGRNLRVIASQGKRAGDGSLDALAALAASRRHADTWIEWAVAGCRAEGLSDTQIGVALGYDRAFARQEVHRRFGRRGSPAGRRQVSYTGTGPADDATITSADGAE